MKFSFLPAEVKFYDYFDQATTNLQAGAHALEQLLNDIGSASETVAEITEIEHRGDFIVHEVMHLLPRTLITPIDHDDIQRLVSAVDDALDAAHDAARHLILYQVTEVKRPAQVQARLIVESAQELHAALGCLSDKKHYPQAQQHIVQINTLENNGDLVLEEAVGELVAQRDDWFDFMRWKEIYELLEETLDRIEDAADIIQRVMIANA